MKRPCTVRLLVEHGWTRRELAAATGWTLDTVDDLAIGRAPVTDAVLKTLRRIARTPAPLIEHRGTFDCPTTTPLDEIEPWNVEEILEILRGVA